jgi:thiol:disulfide interchange protein
MRRWYGLLLGLVTTAALLLLAIPMFLIRPFVSQTPRGLAISYQLRSINPMVTLVLFGIGAWLTFRLWRSSLSRLQKLLVVTASILLLVAAFMARQNHFEWIFHPMPQPGYVVIPKATHVKDSDMVLGIQIGGESRAYPVRVMAYHHLVNDLVAGQPLVVTY